MKLVSAREFWVSYDGTFETDGQFATPRHIHVIEYSAYQALQEKFEELQSQVTYWESRETDR